MPRYPRNLIGMQKPDFQRVFKENHKSGDSMLLLLTRPNGLCRSRLGLAISKKYISTAVERNRIKRIVRESFMRHQPFATPSDTVVINRPGLAKQGNQAVFQSLSRHWYILNQKLDSQGV